MIEKMLEAVERAAKERCRAYAALVELPPSNLAPTPNFFDRNEIVCVPLVDDFGRPEPNAPLKISPTRAAHMLRIAIYEATWPGEVARSRERFMDRLMALTNQGKHESPR